MVTYFILKSLNQSKTYLFTRNIHVKPISTHSGWGGGWTYQLECETRCFARLTLAGQRLFTTWAFFKKAKKKKTRKTRIDGNNPVLLQTRRMWWRCMSCGFRSGTETHRVKNYSWACNLLVPDAAAPRRHHRHCRCTLTIQCIIKLQPRHANYSENKMSRRRRRHRHRRHRRHCRPEG